ncbi:uncharacterized protein B0H18DRAFT_1210442 [Fomitopsis serialis]|uniref:uncharacterized protein n=1 Tax=Fomitopsis serialis TaxID=139415 RepID=UPI0020072697|nr:uncharacterized protein B0H18DRAFT_1210442 [Neoantrodia serialis]KAH9928188.1 hypothetical protein B0H18DRAFT_1210442 [Neoantrodia serialis]
MSHPPMRRPPIFPITEAQLVSLFMQSFAFGVHALVFAVCMHRWFCRFQIAGLGTKSWPWMVVATSLFILGGVDVSLNLYDNIIAFVFFKRPGGADLQFETISNWINIVRSVLYFLVAMLSDAALIYRCWIVYAHWKPRWAVIVLPTLLWLGAIVCATVDVYYVSTLHKLATIPHEKTLRPYLFATYLMSLLLNFLVTGLIVYRMRALSKQTSSFIRQQRWNRLKTVSRIFMESALMYTLSVVISAVMEMISNDAFYGTTDVSVELAGIAFDLIIIRLWTENTREESRTITESFIMEPPPARPRLNSLGHYQLRFPPPPSRVSFAHSERGSVHTNISKVRRI